MCKIWQKKLFSSQIGSIIILHKVCICMTGPDHISWSWLVVNMKYWDIVLTLEYFSRNGRKFSLTRIQFTPSSHYHVSCFSSVPGKFTSQHPCACAGAIMGLHECKWRNPEAHWHHNMETLPALVRELGGLWIQLTQCRCADAYMRHSVSMR